MKVWFWNKKRAPRDLRATINERLPETRKEQPPDTPKTPPISSKLYWEEVVPVLVRRWEQHCFCQNPHFLKLISFNFESYKIAPMRLIDSDHVISQIVLKRFEPVNGWSETKKGSLETQRTDRCPQCGTTFVTRYEQYSINMDRAYTMPEVPLETAAIGQYVAGYFYWANQQDDLQKITDFKLAESIEKFLELLTQST
jgi:hypothetical protein